MPLHMALTDLPNEILFLIAESVESLSPRRLKDVYSLIRTSRRFAKPLISRLRGFAAAERYRISALLWAAAIGDEQMVRFLVERGVAYVIVLPQSQNQSSQTSGRCSRSNEEVVRLVLEEGPNLIVTPRRPGWKAPAMSYAVLMGYNNLGMLLLEKGADITMKDCRGEGLLHHVVSSDIIAESIARKVIELGANLEEPDSYGVTPLQCAARCGNPRFIRVLLEYGADACRGEISAFTRALGWGPRPLIPLLPAEEWNSVGKVETIRQLVKYGSIDFKDMLGNTGLHLAAFTNDGELAEALLRRGSKVDARQCQRKTPLHLAASTGSTMVFSLLLRNNADMNARDLHGKTPLHWAAMSGHSRMVRILVEAGIDTDVWDHNGNTPIHLATRFKHTGTVRLLLWKGVILTTVTNCGSTALHSAAKWGDAVVVRMLLEKGADFTARDKDGRTPLLLAAKYGHVVVVKVLLESGADIMDRDRRGRGTPEWVVKEVLNHPERCVLEMPNISLVNRLRREKDKGNLYTFARDFLSLQSC